MKTGTPPARIASFRRSAFVALIVSASPFLGACVSAIDDTSVFGFNTSAPPSEIGAEAAAAGTDGETTLVAGEVSAGGDAAAGTADAAPAGNEGDIAVAAAQADVAPAADDIVASGSTSLASFADVSASAAPKAGGREADRSLFASLFTRAEAKTPIAYAESQKSRRVLLRREGAPVDHDNALPGVDPSSLFEIGRRASADDEDMLEDVGTSYEVASLTGMARLAPNGLLVQRDDVETRCFEPRLVNLLRTIERKFGGRVVVTSGYRSPEHNRRVNGATRSQHMACKAADIQIPGVSGAAIAQFVRSLPNRGGVGTYCHTTSVHVDIGRKRDWNWSCRRSRG